MFKEIEDVVFKCEDFLKIFNHFNHLNIIIYTNVETPTGTKKCEFCEKDYDALVIWMCCKNSQELPEDGVDERRNASELRSDKLTKSVH